MTGLYAGPGGHALIAFIDPAGDAGVAALRPDWFHAAGVINGPLDAEGGQDPSRISVSTGGGFISGAGDTRIVIPIEANFNFGDFNAVPKKPRCSCMDSIRSES